jgi:hypothetical protein
MLFSFPLQAQIKESSLYIKPIIAYEEGFAQFVKRRIFGNGSVLQSIMSL